MKTRRYRTEASARRILRQRWKTALRHHHIPAGTQFRTQAEDLGVNPKNTRMTRALFLVNNDGQAFPGLSGGVPFTPPKRRRQKANLPAPPLTTPGASSPEEREGRSPLEPPRAPPPGGDSGHGPIVPILWTPGHEGTLPADMPSSTKHAATNAEVPAPKHPVLEEFRANADTDARRERDERGDEDSD